MKNLSVRVTACAAAAAFASSAIAIDPWADGVLSYTPGEGAGAFTSSGTALGMPTRMTGIGTKYQSAATPFNAAYEASDIVSVGRGGSLVVQFDEPVTDDAANPFGIDLLIFGNSFYADSQWPQGIVAGFFSGGGTIEVSADGADWRTIPGVQADGLHPTLAFSDLTDPYSPTGGGTQSDFTRPVDPSFEAELGMTFAEICAGYAGSGGGAGVDIGLVGLIEVRFVRISNPIDGADVSQIDAFADVTGIPAPASVLAFGISTIPAWRRRRA